jgi:orotidine-5'-phosphate decarboxylase
MSNEEIVNPESRLIIALDMPDAGAAYEFCQRLALPKAIFKVGLELLFTGGADLIRKLTAEGYSVFADAKLYDIGNTVERAAAQLAGLGVTFLTVHAQDKETLEAANRGREGSQLKLLGVTLLTSTRPNSLGELGINLSTEQLVLRRASFAAETGCDGVISSPLEARSLKAAFGDRLSVVCPGIRPENSGMAIAGDDQARAATPRAAFLAGADYIVVGRPILRADDPVAASKAIIAEIAAALSESESSANARN